MYAASTRRSRRYLRNWSVTASASSPVAAASTLSATPLPGPLRSWPDKSIRRGAVQRVLPPSEQLVRGDRPSPDDCFDSLTMLSWCVAGRGFAASDLPRGDLVVR